MKSVANKNLLTFYIFKEITYPLPTQQYLPSKGRFWFRNEQKYKSIFFTKTLHAGSSGII